MRFMRQNFMEVAGRLGRWRPRGFALEEVACALLLVLLSLGFALSVVEQMQRRRNCVNYIEDLRVIAAAFEHEHQQRNAWPPSSSAEIELPPDLAKALAGTNWLKGSPFGGNYTWVAPDPTSASTGDPGRGWGGRGAVALTAFSPDAPLSLRRSDLLFIDRKIDDGNPAAGRFRTGFNGWPVFLVEAAKR